jgi:DNA-binding MarR family transcriptional regulator
MGEALKKRISQANFESYQQEAMLNLLVASDFLRNKLEEVFAQFGISSGQYNVLRILRGVYPDGHSRCEVINRLVEKSPDVTRLVDRLEAQGLAERDHSESDRRLSITRITPKGLELVIGIEPALKEMERFFAERVSRKDCRELSRICEGLYGEE